jgi:hypothetical protein
MLEAWGAASDVVVNSSILSGRGHVTLNSADQVDINASVQTGGHGTVYIVAGNDIDLSADVTTASGDILVNAGGDLKQSDLVQSTAGDIGLIAERNILQSASGDTSTSTGNVLIDADANWEMDGDATITVGGGKVLGQTQSGRILLGVIQLTNATVNQVALSAGTGLVDANAVAINIYESTASSVTSVSLRSGGAIGNADSSNPLPGQNFNALDLNVDVVSASAVAGIYLREVAAGGGISVSRVETVNVSIDGIQRSRFNSDSTDAGQDRTVGALEDLVTNNGPIKIVTENGTITIGGGNDAQAVSGRGNGDILVEARGAGSDVVVNAAISSGSGHVTLNATDDVNLNSSLSTGGSGTVYMNGAGVSIDAAVTTENGDVLITSTQGISQTAAIESVNGDVGLIASLAIVQSSSGDITTVAGDVLIEAGTDWTMSSGTVIIAGGGDFDGKALTGDIALGRINSERTALTAGSDISDANSTTLNIDGTSLSLRAGGLIGNSDASNGTPLSNTNAIDTQISTLAAVAGTGIYIEEANSLTIDAIEEVNVSVDDPVRSNFKSTTTDVSQARSTGMLEDLTTRNNGPIKVVTLNGSLTVNGGNLASLAVSANGTGDVLLEARGTGSDLILNSDVMSGTGHVNVVAADSISITRDIVTGGAGRILVEATSGSITLTDADANITGIKTTSGDILLRAGQNVTLNADLESTSANIGVDAGIDLQQNRNITAGGDVLMVSGQNISMAATAETKADGGEMILAAGQNISLGLLQATNVSLNAGADLRDTRVSEATNIRATNLRMIAVDEIGDADSASDSGTNLNAIDTEVTNLAARSGTGIYVREVSSGGSVVVRDVAAISVNVTSGRVNFNSTLSDVLLTERLSGLSDLTTTRGGNIKLLAENGTIMIEDGGNGVSQSSNAVGVAAGGTGAVLLEARGGGSDIVMNSEVRSGSGHITMNAADDVNLTDDVATSGSGTVYLRSQNNATDGVSGIVMANGTSITTGGGNVRLVADNESDIQLGLINAGTGDVSLNAERSVLDNNGSALNIQSEALRIVADADISEDGSMVSLDGNRVGIIGGTDTGNGTPTTNLNALDLQVATLAAQSADGIYLREMDGVTIQSTGEIAVQQANFNSSTSTQTDSSLSDLVTTNIGPVKVLSTRGTITVADGDRDGVGVFADGTGNVLLQALGDGGDVIVHSVIESVTGHITLSAADDIDINAEILTGGSGTVYLRAENTRVESLAGHIDGVSVDGEIRTAAGDILIDSMHRVSQTRKMTSSSGSIGILAVEDYLQSETGNVIATSGDVLVEAHGDWTMASGTKVSALGEQLIAKTVNGSMTLSELHSKNIALTAEGDILDANGGDINIDADTLNLRATTGQAGTAEDSLESTVDIIAAATRTGVFILETDSVRIDEVSEVTVLLAHPMQVAFNSTISSVFQTRTIERLEDLTSTGNGALAIRTINGSITVEGGRDDAGISSTGRGRIGLQAGGQIDGQILVNGTIIGNLGRVDLDADGAIHIKAEVRTSGNGELSFTANGNSQGATSPKGITINAPLSTNRGNITLYSSDTINQAATIRSFGADITLIATKDIGLHADITSRYKPGFARDESIHIESIDGNILLSRPDKRTIEISTDDVTGSLPTTNDQIRLIAGADNSNGGNNAGVISILADVIISTDGGVAKKFGPRPEAGMAGTAFFEFVSSPLPVTLDNQTVLWNARNAYINAFDLVIGITGEENLEIDLDWRDPVNEVDPPTNNHPTMDDLALQFRLKHPLRSEQTQQFLIATGGELNRIAHLYTADDYSLFQKVQNTTTIVIDLSVSHHESIDLQGSKITQSNESQIVPGRDIASTDNFLTKPNIFENGIAQFKIPTTTPAPPALFTNTFVPRADRPFNVAPPENQAAVSAQSTAEFGGGAVGGSVFSTEVYFQIRRQYETDGPAEVVIERITDSSLISSREAFEKFVEQNPELQDGAGYEIWLISETAGQKVERPIVEFEISGGQPGTMHESVPEGSSTQQLKDLPFEQPAESETIPEKQDPEIPQANIDADVSPSELASQQAQSEAGAAALAVSGITMEEEETSTPASDILNPSSGAVVGLMVRRFRKRQQESSTSQSTFSRAARFQRKHSSPGSDLQVRGSSDV